MCKKQTDKLARKVKWWWFSSSVSGSECHMVLSGLPLLFPTRHQTQISYLGYCPGRQAHTCIDWLTHSDTHMQVFSNCEPANNTTPSVSWDAGQEGPPIQTRYDQIRQQRVLSGVNHLLSKSYTTIWILWWIGASVYAWMYEYVRLPWCEWKGFPRQQPVL